MATEYPTGRPTIDYPFAPIPEGLLYDTEVSSTAVRIYGVLARFAYEEGANNLQVTHEEIAGRLGCSARSIARPLADLEARGWIERQTCNTWLGRTADFFHLNSQRAESRTGVGAQRAESRTRDRADSRGLTTPKEGEILTSTGEAQVLPIADTPTKKQELEAEFVEWWSGIWRKERKQSARKHYLRIRSKGLATREHMFIQRDAYAKLMRNLRREQEHMRMPANWLADGDWEDDVPEHKAPHERPEYFQGPEMEYA